MCPVLSGAAAVTHTMPRAAQTQAFLPLKEDILLIQSDCSMTGWKMASFKEIESEMHCRGGPYNRNFTKGILQSSRK